MKTHQNLISCALHTRKPHIQFNCRIVFSLHAHHAPLEKIGHGRLLYRRPTASISLPIRCPSLLSPQISLKPRLLLPTLSKAQTITQDHRASVLVPTWWVGFCVEPVNLVDELGERTKFGVRVLGWMVWMWRASADRVVSAGWSVWIGQLT
jgi:hypothetical protein